MPNLLQAALYDAKTMKVIGDVVRAGLAYGRQLEKAKLAKNSPGVMKIRKRLVHLETAYLMTAIKLHKVAVKR